ncbi:hypothetical protein Hdeb2414_s0022g00612051 [Helianthus debilis subsp. tardiflorus]
MSIVGCHHNYYLIVGLLFVISGCGHAGKPKRQLSYLNHHHSRGFGDQKERDLGLHGTISKGVKIIISKNGSKLSI